MLRELLCDMRKGRQMTAFAIMMSGFQRPAVISSETEPLFS